MNDSSDMQLSNEDNSEMNDNGLVNICTSHNNYVKFFGRI